MNANGEHRSYLNVRSSADYPNGVGSFTALGNVEGAIQGGFQTWEGTPGATDDGGEFGTISILHQNETSLNFDPSGVGGFFNMYDGAKVHGDLEVIGGTAFNTSDERFKKDITPLCTDALSHINDMYGVTYDWRIEEYSDKNFSERLQMVLIAQQVEQHFPELIKTDSEGYKAVNYAGFSAVLLLSKKLIIF